MQMSTQEEIRDLVSQNKLEHKIHAELVEISNRLLLNLEK